MKCLEKDRTRRYESASGLARDIQRYLADEPVEACPPRTGYRLRKLAHKYRTPLRVAGLFLVLLILAAITSTWQAIRATLAENRASEQRDVARRKEFEAILAREETSKAYSQLTVANRNLERTTGDLRLALYVSDVNSAYKFWEEGNVQRVEELLERHRPGETAEDLRGVEWHYLRRLATRFQAGRIADVQEPVLSLAISPDGNGWPDRAAVASPSGMPLPGPCGFTVPTLGIPSGVHRRWRGPDFRTWVPDARARLPNRHRPGARLGWLDGQRNSQAEA